MIPKVIFVELTFVIEKAIIWRRLRVDRRRFAPSHLVGVPQRSGQRVVDIRVLIPLLIVHVVAELSLLSPCRIGPLHSYHLVLNVDQGIEAFDIVRQFCSGFNIAVRVLTNEVRVCCYVAIVESVDSFWGVENVIDVVNGDGSI